MALPFKMAVEDSPEAVTITRGLPRFPWPHVQENEIMKALCRRKSSWAVRFSEPPASDAAPDDSLRDFDSYTNDRASATATMGKIFNAASSALASYATLEDDRRTHQVTATIPSLAGYPLRLEFALDDMTSEARWARHRPVGVWIMGAFSFVRMSVDRVERAREERRLRVILETYSWSDESLYRAVMRAGRIANNSAFLDVCVKLSKLPSSAVPAYEAVSGMQLFTNVPTDSCVRRILDAVYGATPLSCVEESQQNTVPTIPVVDGSPISINRRDELEEKPWTNEREYLVLAERDVSDLIDKVVEIMFLKYQPQVVAITTSSLLNATGKGDIFKNYLDDFELIICDEASQVPEPVFAAMLSRLPKAAHPLVNELPNHFVYAGELRSGTAAEERHTLLNMRRFPNHSLPFMFLDVSGSFRRATHSHFNDAEAISICIITFYKEQHRRLADFARDNGVDLSTVDAIQGRKKNVVVLLTTKTDFQADAAEFLDDPHRMNVALTRCKLGQFVLGHQASLAVVLFWNAVLAWARQHGAIVPAMNLGDYLPPE
ncbi:unnamed protein product [Heligmosomoides polygyrus]|uniref:AAA_12 domain-containing protein n=1 Tax=Heligmosomoides polygyrus TaxID=6339 RepID=A0A183G8X0_HELPZ|nr:unnamed protein product [Heligmosomoides polygyrus]